jgi:DNA-binding IclR family transcriptional regulator
MTTETPNAVRSVETSLRIINTLAAREGGGVTEIASALDIAVSTVHNHLSTLKRNGYVVKDGDTYQISFEFLEHGGRIRSNMELFKKGRSKADNLAEETGELVNLMIEENGYGVHIYLTKGGDAITFDSYAGKRSYLHYNALGKAILAQYSREQAERIIDRHGLPKQTPNTVTTKDELFDTLETIQEQGYALDNEERLEGLRCVAAPITSDESVLGSISVSGPASRIKDRTFRETLPEKVVRTADIIGINITYS